ncbi:TetR/AcrR family transcriptional regulator [Paenibacillus sedimenti]|uniref:TetR/AcrR family transcriptional regulator n=1 Tax=Paenibacillus sedimenti TaxID=2770274 RepID=A0A926QL31_9BACL|nr:TetR/AcrR family transcriptional regulator [Paenibacillus sedimenti]MBD0383170.1 TetR/AcrR family transcriptional regulator [Paenibacillus sedimenti]
MAKKELQTAANRKEDILEAAVAVFAEHGYYRATTALVAQKAGISQPYVFRFFGTKEELFVAALERAFGRIYREFSRVDSTSEGLIPDLIAAYEELSEAYPNEIALQLQAMAIPEESIREAARQGWLSIRDLVLDKFTKAGIEQAEDQVVTFMARGIFCNIVAVLEVPALMFKDHSRSEGRPPREVN